MKKRFNGYPFSALVLIALAVVLMVIMLITNRGDITSATLIIAACACFFAGIFTLTFSQDEGVNRKMVPLLSVAGMVSHSRVCADLGISGNACTIPAENYSPAGVAQFNPVSPDDLPTEISDDVTYYTGSNEKGLLSVPAGAYLLRMLEKDFSFMIPGEEGALFEAIQDVLCDSLEVCTSASVSRSGESIVAELTGYALFQGCMAVREESPKCCTLAPCPVCSLVLCILTKGMQKRYNLQSVVVDDAKKKVELVIVECS